MWRFSKRGDAVVILLNGQPARSKSGHIFGDVHAVQASGDAEKILVTFEGGVQTKFDVKKFDWSSSELMINPGRSSDDLSVDDFVLLANDALGDCGETSNNVQRASTPHKKRSHNTKLANETPAKRRVVQFQDTFDRDVREKCLGEYDVPLDCLQQPPSQLLLRPLSAKHKEQIKEGLKETINCSTVVPVLLIGDDFGNAKTSQYYTLGGNHLTAAMRDLKDDNAFAALKMIRVKVYKGLSRTESLRVASLHNVGTHLVQDRTLRDDVDVCRSLLYELNNVSEHLAEPPPSSKVWREHCGLALGKKAPINTKDLKAMEPTFQLAQYRRRCYEKLLKVFALFEKKNGKCLKQTVFMKLQGLPERSRFDLLSEVLSERLTLAELSKEADKAKKLLKVQKEMVSQLPNVCSWDEAEHLYPLHTTEVAMQPFTGCNFKDGIPRPFLKFIQDAVSWREKQCDAVDLDLSDIPQSLKSDGCTVFFLPTDSMATLNHIPGFTAAKLVMFDMEKHTRQMELAMQVIQEIGQLETSVGVKVSQKTISTATQLLHDQQFQGLITNYQFLPGQTDAGFGTMAISLMATHRKDGAGCGEGGAGCGEGGAGRGEGSAGRGEGMDAYLQGDMIKHMVLKGAREGDWVVDLTMNADVALVACENNRNVVVMSTSDEGLRAIKKKVASHMQISNSNEQESTDNEDTLMSLDSDS